MTGQASCPGSGVRRRRGAVHRCRRGVACPARARTGCYPDATQGHARRHRGADHGRRRDRRGHFHGRRGRCRLRDDRQRQDAGAGRDAACPATTRTGCYPGVQPDAERPVAELRGREPTAANQTRGKPRDVRRGAPLAAAPAAARAPAREPERGPRRRVPWVRALGPASPKASPRAWRQASQPPQARRGKLLGAAAERAAQSWTTLT